MTHIAQYSYNAVEITIEQDDSTPFLYHVTRRQEFKERQPAMQLYAALLAEEESKIS